MGQLSHNPWIPKQGQVNAGATTVIGWDSDHAVLDQAFILADRAARAFLPLYLDAANPSPAQGWNQSERRGIAERAGNCDAVLALAVLHHIAISRNVPLPDVMSWLIGLAPTGIIEFPLPSDPMAKRLLAARRGPAPDYTLDAFFSELRNRARIVREASINDGHRVLIWYDRS